MTNRPSEPLLKWLRTTIQERNLTTASVAADAKLPRQRVRKVLTGKEDMTVDELLTITQSLGLTPEELGLAGVEIAEEPEPVEVAAVPATPDTPDAGVRVDRWGNQPAQLLRAAFDLGCDVLFVTDTAALEGSGVPEATLASYKGRALPIKLDALYHKHNQPEFEPSGLSVTLSFDTLRRCHFPWTAIQQVVFFPAPPEEPEPEETEVPDEEPVPFLRLVT